MMGLRLSGWVRAGFLDLLGAHATLLVPFGLGGIARVAGSG